MSVSANDILEVGIVSELYNQVVMSILHYRVIAAPTQNVPITSQEDVLNLLTVGGASDILTKYFAGLSSNLTLQYMSAQYIWPTRYRKSFVTPAIVGGIAQAAKTANIAGTITKLADLAGRKNRGSLHLPGIPTSDVDSGKITGGTITAMSNLADQLVQEVDEAGGGTGVWYPVIYHRGAPGGTGPVWITSLIQTTVRTMRRRTVGLGI